MDQHWTALSQGLHQASIGLQQASIGLQQALSGFLEAAEAARRASAEHGDLSKTIQRLEVLIGMQSERITALERAIHDKGSSS
jgi:hypothetical protein